MRQPCAFLQIAATDPSFFKLDQAASRFILRVPCFGGVHLSIYGSGFRRLLPVVVLHLEKVRSPIEFLQTKLCSVEKR
ncbi:hypothetical protein BT93_C0757 [Corymbia citriodora subsp. variegata]|nr:hypothetical protein BT93_C0757 [Corymbia citriodora subsp. variegata]